LPLSVGRLMVPGQLRLVHSARQHRLLPLQYNFFSSRERYYEETGPDVGEFYDFNFVLGRLESVNPPLSDIVFAFYIH